MSHDLPRRPLSPHLQIWRWHVTMLSSIVHRATGTAAVAGIILVTAWLICLAIGPKTYAEFLLYAASPFGLVVWFGLSLAGFVHLVGGVRHLIWDLGLGFTPKNADALAGWGMVLGVVLTLVFWAFLFLSHKVVL